ncbi:uncharacterized protein LOC119283885 [Triticum dicoccoides]|uniref:uncharacterized protein LOC119283885 n=1 Tax=Triticum dicoccoides TaxID=85692 RepID=UPI001890A0F0|nr:uncharacterized protein LOC119283885 [Triticum dicoccoides]
MATAATTGSALSMKLLVDTKAQRVLFAEASKDVVDFLFSLLALPVGTAVKLLGKDSMVGCVGNLYGSVEKLDGTYVQPGAAKDALLHPVVLCPGAAGTNMLIPSGAPCSCREPPAEWSLLGKKQQHADGRAECWTPPALPSWWPAVVDGLPEATSGGQPKALYKCSRCNNSFVSETSSTNCPSCGYKMTTALRFVSGSWGQTAQAAAGVVCGKGFVQGIVTYTVMDDLSVNPMSSISSIALLNAFAVKDLGALQEKTVQLGYKEGLAILRASLQSKTVLTDVFLAKTQLPGRA